MLPIIDKRKYTYVFSGLLVVLSILAVSVWGLNLGIDFKGGTLMEVQFSENVPGNQEIRDKLQEFDLKSLTVQPSEENSVILRYLASDEELNEKVVEKLKEFDENLKQLRVDFIGASISQDLQRGAVWAIILAVIGIALYIAWAFRKVSKPIASWQYGIWAVVALTHDIIITVGIFAVLGKYLDVEVGVPFIAALLTILGYSVNDTIVVYDRVRENLLRGERKDDFEETVNRSLNQTLARSINTSSTVIIVLLAIIFLGGVTIQYFAVALLIGIFFGTYSSIFVASALLVTSYKRKMR